MVDQTFFLKKFSVGLALNSTCSEFRQCLEKFHLYIDNIYMSPPMGDRFHGRNQIAEQMRDKDIVRRFWEMAELIKEYGISLEVVFNTHELFPGDIENCREVFDEHRITVDKVAVLDSIDWYYDDVKMYFPEAAIVQSVNNMKNSADGFRQYRHFYDEMVVGRHLIRDTETARVIKEEMGAKCILLLNNGCSFFCGGCQDADYCRRSYETSRDRYSAEYLYALQSILPYELHEEYFPLQYYDYFKLSTRNGDADYVYKTLDSYINNSAEEYIARGNKHYLLWGRLKWHIPYYDTFDYDRIRKYKRQICSLEDDSRSVSD